MQGVGTILGTVPGLLTGRGVAVGHADVPINYGPPAGGPSTPRVGGVRLIFERVPRRWPCIIRDTR